LKIFDFGGTKVVKISFQPTQQQIYTPKKSKKDNDIETSELLCPAAFSLFQIAQYKGRKNVLNTKH